MPLPLVTDRLHVVLARPEQAAAHVDFFVRNDAHFRPWDPPRPVGVHAEAFWREQLQRAVDEFDSGTAVRLAGFANSAPERMVLRINLTQIARGPFQSAILGYAVCAAEQGTGLMTEALHAVIGYAFSELGLHRIEANVVPENRRSLRLLERLGFERIGLARRYLFIDGAWRDHVQHQLINANFDDSALTRPSPH
jgi:ribosomal-protein-alanine N-acetyltransferase